jgi:photosystem II stability/assembly factor-like uncharacterized protein
MKKTILYNSFLLISVFFLSCNAPFSAPKPTEIFENENGEQEGGYRQYYEESRRAALGDDWESITQDNLERASQTRLFPKEDAFAGGALQGNWYERGGSTVSGSIVATAFYPATEEIYAISSSGTLLKGGLTGGAWTNISDALNFNNKILAVVPIAGGKRIITAKSDKKIYYSDDNGATWAQSSGISPYDSWGSGKKLIVLGNGVIYYLMHSWIASPWGSGYILYRSDTNGATWTTTQTFNSRNENKVAMWSPFGTNELYVLENGTTLYSLSGTATTLTNLTTGMSLPTDNDYSFSGYKNGANLTLYVLANSDALYKTTNNGTNWTNVTTFTTASPALAKAWSVGILANPWVADALYYGEVDFHKSSNGGANWAIQNSWGSYYGNIDLLHADMVSMTPFQKTDGTKFLLIGNHGGIHYYPDPYTTTTNLTKTNVTNAEYYDVTTIGTTIFAGAQDQGNQRFATGTATNILTASQLISGDYVRLNTSANSTKYWQEYPVTSGGSGTFHYYNSPLTQQYTTAQTQVYGTPRTNIQQWVAPTCNWAIPSENSILVGGGMSASGSTESHVIKLTYNSVTNAIDKTQYAFDFMAAGGGYITAIDHSPANANYMYVGLNNGKFFYSQDAGATWTQTAGFTGPTNGWNYGSFIHASRLNRNLAFYSGGGGKIYKTTNGGVSFADMSTGLPNTFVSEMVLNSSETLLFAATDAGPYVCLLSTGQWYSMTGTTAPVKAFRAVEFFASTNTARFATFGRGVWDFQITAQPLPVSYTSFDAQEINNQQISIKWATGSERDLTHFEVEKSTDGVNFATLAKEKAGNKANRYAVIDPHPSLEGVNYYRVKSVELSGKMEYTNIKSVSINQKSTIVQVFPTVLQSNGLINISSNEGNQQFYILDNQGRVVMNQKLRNRQNQLNVPNLPSGVYFYAIQKSNNVVVKSGKLMVL